MPVKFTLRSTGLKPFLVEDGGLLAQVDIVVKCIVIELWVWKAIWSGLQLVCLVEDVHHFDDSLHYFLLEYLFHNHNRYVELELLHDSSKFLFGQTLGYEFSRESLVCSIWLLPECVMALCEQVNHAFESSIEIEDLHFTHHQKHRVASHRNHMVLRTLIILSFCHVLWDVQENQKLINHYILSSLKVWLFARYVRANFLIKLLHGCRVNSTLTHWVFALLSRALVDEAAWELVEVLEHFIELALCQRVEVLSINWLALGAQDHIGIWLVGLQKLHGLREQGLVILEALKLFSN